MGAKSNGSAGERKNTRDSKSPVVRSADILHGPEWANVRSLYKASGFTGAELEKPKVAVVNTWNDVCPGHVAHKQMAARVREGVAAAGGMALEFGVIGACDGIAMGHDGMKYILPGREVVADSIETMVEAQRLDALVLIGSCDKIVPGMLMAALRMNIPAIFINGGPALPGRMREGNPYGGQYLDHSVIQQSEGALTSGRMSQEMFDWIEDNAVPTIGSCAMLGTANTMCCLAEAMGMALPGTAAIPAVYSARLAAAYASGLAVMDLVRKNIRPRDIVTKNALENAIRVNSAIGGSTNAVLHLLALADEGEIDLDLDGLGNISGSIPHLVSLIPAGEDTLLDFYEAGGVPAVMNELSSRLHLDCLTCTGDSIGASLNGRMRKETSTVIQPLETPVHKRGGIAVLKGNLAPDGAVTKPSAIPEDALLFTGPARIFESEADALAGIRGGRIQPGDVVVIRNEGPKGSPGMPEMYKAMKLLVGMGLGSQVCLITDGRFSGSNNGCFVGHICPEAFDGGPIAKLREGDTITVDVLGGSIAAPDVDFAQRELPEKEYPALRGVLGRYRDSVSSASQGAVVGGGRRKG